MVVDFVWGMRKRQKRGYQGDDSTREEERDVDKEPKSDPLLKQRSLSRLSSSQVGVRQPQQQIS